MKRLISLVLALVMVLMVGAAFASGDGTGDNTGDSGTTGGAESTTYNIKITPPAGLADDASNTYKIYKVFDATQSGSSISYKLVSGKNTAPAGFTVDNAGNVTYTGSGTDGQLTDADIEAIAAYVTSTDLVDTLTATGTAAVTSKNLDPGYYFITTTTGTVVTIDSTNPKADVSDKNTVPGVDKKITGANSIDADGKAALAQVGTDVTYTAEITVGKGAKDYVFHDTMEAGLTYKGDAAVTGVEAGENTYTVGKVGDDTFTITFSNTYINTLNVGDKITITYSATVNDDAITTDPLNNTAYVSYGDKNSNNKTPTTEANVYEAKFTVTKKDGDGKALAGAGFVIKNSDGKYYKLTTTTTGEGDAAVTTNVVSWVDSIDDATEYESDENGAVDSFTGLANGTYTLVEKTVPDGYNKAADSTFTIAEHDYTAGNLEQKADVTNNAGTELPSTGGIGTTIFYVVGGLLLIGAAVVLVARRKASN